MTVAGTTSTTSRAETVSAPSAPSPSAPPAPASYPYGTQAPPQQQQQPQYAVPLQYATTPQQPQQQYAPPPPPGVVDVSGKRMRYESLKGKTLSNATIVTCNISNCTLTNCNVTEVEFKGTTRLINCIIKSVSVQGHVTVQNGTFDEGEVKNGGRLIADNAAVSSAYLADSTLTSCKVTEVEFKGTNSLAHCTAREVSVQGNVTVEGGSFDMVEVKSKGRLVVNNATMHTAELCNSTLSNCNVTAAEFQKGSHLLTNCTTQETEVRGEVTVQGGVFGYGEVKRGGVLINQGAEIRDIEGYNGH
eukprot:Rhum_TRINITY_DN24841_c0_g1::Rhum_TRINITY_DN24841_c0_g1_i1::g.180284::m.180284